MTDVVHPKPPEIAGLSIDEIAARFVARFVDRRADWDAFADARAEGYRRAQHRFIGAGGSGKHDDPNVIPPRAFTLSIMYVEPGQGNAAHTHEVEEVFSVLLARAGRDTRLTCEAVMASHLRSDAAWHRSAHGSRHGAGAWWSRKALGDTLAPTSTQRRRAACAAG